MNSHLYPRFDPDSEIETIRAVFNNIIEAMVELKISIRKDAGHGFGAITMALEPEHLHLKEAMSHPWLNKSITGNHIQHEKVMMAYSHMAFEKDSDANRTFSFPGVISSSSETIAIAKRINELKLSFRERILLFKKDNKHVNDSDIEKSISNRSGEKFIEAAAKSVFGKAGLSGICVKEVYRLIPIIGDEENKPVRIRHYYKLKQPSRKTTAGAVLATMISKQKMGDSAPIVEKAIRILSSMSPSQVISERQTPSEFITVNYKLVDEDGNLTKWNTASGVMPVMIPPLAQPKLESIVQLSSLNMPYEERQRLNLEKSKRVTAQSIWQVEPFIEGLKFFLPLK